MVVSPGNESAAGKPAEAGRGSIRVGSQAVERLGQLIGQSHDIVFFGGAGMSTASGIPDFRSAQGLYRRPGGQTCEEMLSIRFFRNQPDAFWDFYRQAIFHPEAKPNAGHAALARLERQGRLKAVVTQNIDGLHQRAGSKRVIELHGSVWRNRCTACGRAFAPDELPAGEGAPRCSCGGVIRPDIVFYGEALDSATMEEAIRAIGACDLLIVGGTSLAVYPAAGLVRYRGQARFALVNHDPTPFDDTADLIVRDGLAQALDAAVPQ